MYIFASDWRQICILCDIRRDTAILDFLEQLQGFVHIVSKNITPYIIFLKISILESIRYHRQSQVNVTCCAGLGWWPKLVFIYKNDKCYVVTISNRSTFVFLKTEEIICRRFFIFTIFFFENVPSKKCRIHISLSLQVHSRSYLPE